MFDRNTLVLVLIGSLWGLALVPPLAFAQQPKPPTLCIDGSADCELVAVPPTGGIKWHPGHYVKTQGNECGDQTTYFNGVQRDLTNGVMSSTELIGALVVYGWGALEPDNGVYDWSRVYTNLNWHAARGKYLIVTVDGKCFSGSNPEWMVPANLATLGIGYESYGPSIIAAIWREQVMDQVIAFWQAFAAEFDGHPNIEMVAFFGESCPSWGQAPEGPPADYSHSRLLAQQIRLYDAMQRAFKETSAAGPWNCSQGGTIINGIEALYQRGLGHISADSHDDSGNVIFRGEAGAIRDYRGTIPHRTIVSQPNLGGKDNILPLSNIQSLLDRGQMTHVLWVLSSGVSGGTKSNIISHIEAPGNDTFEACPTQFTALHGGCQ